MLKTSELGKDTERETILTRRAALMAAAGKSDKDIAKALDVSPGTLNIWKGSPLWQTLVGQYADEIEERGVTSVVEELLADAPKNVNFIKRVRDGAFHDTKDRMQLRMQAAKMLLDKQAPNADTRAQNESAARIILDGKLLGQVLHAMRDVGVIDITPDAIDKATGQTIPQLMGKTPEEFAEGYTPPDPEDEY
jgi:hypothetical protein